MGELGRTDLAWAAGLFDGEGHSRVNASNNFRSPRMELSMTDENVVRRFHQIVESGSVREKKVPLGYKTQYRWVAKSAQAVETMELLWQFLSDPKRQQWLRCLEELENFYVNREKRGPIPRWRSFSFEGAQ